MSPSGPPRALLPSSASSCSSSFSSFLSSSTARPTTPTVLHPLPFSWRDSRTADAAACRLFVADTGVPQLLYADNTPHPGLSCWGLQVHDFPLYPTFDALKPPRYSQLKSHKKAKIYHMPVVPFDLPAHDITEVGKLGKSYKRPTDPRVLTDVLALVKLPHSTRAVMLDEAKLEVVTYQRDIESFSGWQIMEWAQLEDAKREATTVRSPFNPHRFAYDAASSLCYLMPDHSFHGFTSPSWYRKTPGSFFCLHVEQLYAPFYNLCYEGSTTWWAVRQEDRQLLDQYVVQRARQWYDVPANVQLSATEEEAVRGLLYTKHVLFHPDDLVAAGIRVTEVTQLKGQVVLGRGDVVHFGVTTVPPGYLGQKPKSARSINEAVNFIPLHWLTTGLPLLTRWLHWLQRVWLPMQHPGSMAGKGKQHLREAIQHYYTNRLLGLHCPVHWCRAFLIRLRSHLCDPLPVASAPIHPTRQAIDQHLGNDAQVRADIVSNIDAALAVIHSNEAKRWLLEQANVKGEEVLMDYEDE